MNRKSSKNLIGQRFGKLVVVEFSHTKFDGKNYRYYWKCRCDCGNETKVREDCLLSESWYTRSCGCARSDSAKAHYAKNPKPTIHGHSYERLFNIWYLMKYRCENPYSSHYARYGARGIKVCPEWSNGVDGYEAFKKWSQENGYADDLTIDRIDNYKGYSPDNCRWADLKTQARNKTNNVQITYDGRTQTAAEWAEEIGMPYRSFMRRLHSGWDIERAITQPPRKSPNHAA